MKAKFRDTKIGIIKAYAKRKEQYNLSKKEVDAQLL